MRYVTQFGYLGPWLCNWPIRIWPNYETQRINREANWSFEAAKTEEDDIYIPSLGFIQIFWAKALKKLHQWRLHSVPTTITLFPTTLLPRPKLIPSIAMPSNFPLRFWALLHPFPDSLQAPNFPSDSSNPKRPTSLLQQGVSASSLWLPLRLNLEAKPRKVHLSLLWHFHKHLVNLNQIIWVLWGFYSCWIDKAGAWGRKGHSGAASWAGAWC